MRFDAKEIINMSSDSDKSNTTSYNLLKQDSESLVELVDKYVKVSIIGRTYVGFVHSIDPVTYSIILLVPQSNVYQTILIPGHAILDVAKEELSADINPPQRKQTEMHSKKELIKRKIKLKAWFKSNLLPVTELDDKITVGNVSLLPPYSNLDLYTDNPIVALQIKKIMDQMPEDFST